MKLVTVITANGEAEALMFIEMLKQQGIRAVHNLPNNQQFLRANSGGAALPFDVWEVRVAETDFEKAKGILPEPQPRQYGKATTPPAARGFAIFWLTTILIGVAVALRQMIEYFSQN